VNASRVLGCCAALVLAACHAQSAACSPEALALIEAAYVAEAVQECRGYTAETCPALPAIRAKYQLKRQEWVACSPR